MQIEGLGVEVLEMDWLVLLVKSVERFLVIDF